MPDFISPTIVKVDGVWQIEGKPRETFKVLATFNPSNLPGKTIIVGSINCPPNGGTPPHRHGGAAVVAVPIRGTCLNQMNSNEPVSYSVGDFWYEAPGCHHQRSECVGDENAEFLAVLIVDDETIRDGNFGAVFVLDKEVEVGEKEKSRCQC
ncbi:hypothetical protein EJ04DRAFT_504026 [Polyplosphaeria fusca]|uniref:Cupin 2 conserved barrel domain-containing protein n=1 Tax=Polyplosphaeria fusca TaxID=682080 RepID=A0A9P4QN78_9PLEO|nr:hypothetical protein EJ04DRAFT_504026 [Polyplosphaeria fusca]